MASNLSAIKSHQFTERLNSRQMAQLRSSIDAGRIVARLRRFSLAEEELVRDAETGQMVPRVVHMDANQVRAANILLNKCMPDLQSTQLEVKSDLQDVSTAELYARLREVMHMAEEKAGVIEDAPSDMLKLSTVSYSKTDDLLDF